MELEKTFVTIIDAGSLNKAAEAMGIANSTISSRLALLEKKLGVSLLQRTARGIQPTEMGRVYYESVKSAVAMVLEAENKLKQITTDSYGNLVISAPPGLVEHWLSKPIAHFLKANPHVQLDISTDDNVLVHLNNKFDINFLWGGLPDKNIYAQKIFEDAVIVVATDQYIEEHDLRNQPGNIEFLQLTRSYAGESKWLFASRKEVEWVYGNASRVVTNNMECQIGLLLESIGAAVLPKSYITRELEENRLTDITHLYFGQPFPLPCYAITSSRPSQNAVKTQSFIDCIKSFF